MSLQRVDTLILVQVQTSLECVNRERLENFLMGSSSENSCPNVRISYESAKQVSSLELLLPSLLCKLNAADRYRRRFKSLEPEHRPNPLFDEAMLLIHSVV